MKSKLTVSINSSVKFAAMKFAKNKGVSLSNLVENYLRNLGQIEKEEIQISTKVKGLMGVIKLPSSFDYKTELTKLKSKKMAI